MPKAVLLVATHHRPKLLRVCLMRAKQFIVPPGWTFEIVVGVNRSDSGKHAVRQEGATVVFCQGTKVTDKFAAALAASHDADLYLMSGDDDMHSPHRLEDTIALWQQGHKWISSNQSWFFDTQSRKVAWWDGVVPGRMGTFHAFDGELLRSTGWADAKTSADHALIEHMGLQDSEPAPLPMRVANTSVCLSHTSNISRPRPFPPPGQSKRHGSFRVTGKRLQDMPQSLQELVREL